MKSPETDSEGDEGVERQPDPLREFASRGMRPTQFLRRPAQPPGFEILRELARGGQGVVYEAIQRSTGRRIALKVGLARELEGPDEHDRFRREVRLLASLKHDNLITVHESGIADGWRWLAMEFVEGTDLATWAVRQGVGPRQIVERFVQVCDAVGLAHRHGIVHRDLKPSNILVDAADRPVVLDFGLAKQFEASSLQSPDITRAGSIVGSPLWLAPEQIDAPEEVGPRTDVYALGRVLYHLLSGEHPYPEERSSQQWLRNLLDAEPKPLRRIAAKTGVDRGLEAIVMKAIESDASKRYADAAALRADCLAWLDGRALSARPQGPLGHTTRRLRRYPKLSIALLAGAVTLIAVGLSWRRAAPERWRERVDEAAGLPVAQSLAALWTQHLTPPSGVSLPETAAADGPSGPALTHFALLARYLATPSLGRVKLPQSASDSTLRMITAPRGDSVTLMQLPRGGPAASMWIGREPDFDWQELSMEHDFGAHDLEHRWQQSPDGHFLAASTTAGEWLLWSLPEDLEHSAPLEAPWARERRLTGMVLLQVDAVAPGTLALTRDPSDSFQLVRATDGSKLMELPRLSGLIQAPDADLLAAVSPDGGWLAVGSLGSDIWLVSLGDRDAPPRRLQGGPALSFEFLDADTLSVHRDWLRLVSVDEAELRYGPRLIATNSLPHLSWLRNGAMLLQCTSTSFDFVARGETEVVSHWTPPAQIVSYGAIGQGQRVLSLDADGYVSRWDVSQAEGSFVAPPWHSLLPESPRSSEAPPDQDGAVLGIAFSPSSDRVAVTFARPARVLVRSLAEPGQALEFPLAEGDVANSLAWSRTDPNRIAVGCRSGRVYVLAADGRAEPELHGQFEGEVHAVAFSPDGRYLLAGGADATELAGRIRVWPGDHPGPPLHTLDSPRESRVTSLAFSEDGEHLVAGTSNSNQPLSWKSPLPTGFALPTDYQSPLTRCTRDLVVHETGVFSAHLEGTVRFREFGSDRDAAVFSIDAEAFSLDVHPSGALVAVGGGDGALHLLGFGDGRFTELVAIPFPAIRNTAGSRRIFRVRFSPDGRYLVVGGESGTEPCYLDLFEAAHCLAGNLDWALDRQQREPRGAELARAWAEALRSSGD